MTREDFPVVFHGSLICDNDGEVITRESRWPFGPKSAAGTKLKDLSMTFLESALSGAEVFGCVTDPGWVRAAKDELERKRCEAVERFFEAMPRALDEEE